MKKTVLQIIVSCIFLLTGCRLMASGAINSQSDTTSVGAELGKVNTAYGAAFAKGDSSLFLDCYVEDACVMPANSPALCGKRGLLAFYNFGYKAGVRNIVFHTAALFGMTDEYVTEQGTYDMFDADSKPLGKGKYLVVWKKTGSGWKMYRDMFNSDAPPAKS
jgi:ketosteroid isomerase-like protein